MSQSPSNESVIADNGLLFNIDLTEGKGRQNFNKLRELGLEALSRID